MEQRGSLACVGVGMMLGAHLGPRARNCIEQADVVFALVSDALVELWVQQMHPDVRSLQPFYAEGKSRRDTYRQMVEAMLVEVRAGKKVCGAFYGHPGVFARVPHDAIRQAREEGFDAVMEPGVSAEDCLYADLGIDPATYGCQHYEASQLMFYKRRIDPSAYLVLWQIALAGDRSLKVFASSQQQRQILVDLLSASYPLEHEVVVYEAATLAIAKPRIDVIKLSDLPDVELTPHSTLVIKPSLPLEVNDEIIRKLDSLRVGAAA